MQHCLLGELLLASHEVHATMEPLHLNATLIGTCGVIFSCLASADAILVGKDRAVR
jgi:hypothetical protein